ncbi:MAG: hypothetical protein QOI83_3290 [Streptomycetaceae bacterium]|nr:hypothetical protein [Streptomycetaceae bacterium]
MRGPGAGARPIRVAEWPGRQTRTRTVFVQERTRHKHRVERALEDAQIKLSWRTGSERTIALCDVASSPVETRCGQAALCCPKADQGGRHPQPEVGPDAARPAPLRPARTSFARRSAPDPAPELSLTSNGIGLAAARGHDDGRCGGGVRRACHGVAASERAPVRSSRTTIPLDVGWLLMSATLSSGTRTFVSG